MIWFEKEFTKEEYVIILRGIFNDPQTRPESIIIIELLINDSRRILYSHNPSMRLESDPDPDSVYAKYRTKIEKFVRYVENNDLAELTNPIKFK